MTNRPAPFMRFIQTFLGEAGDLLDVRLSLPELGVKFTLGGDEADAWETWSDDDYANAIRIAAELWPKWRKANEKATRIFNQAHSLRAQHDTILSGIEQYEYRRYKEVREETAADRRRARRNASGEHFTSAQWEALKAFCNYTCLACGRTEPDIALVADHIKPLEKGGSDAIGNIQPLCGHCNGRKHTKHIDYRPQHLATTPAGHGVSAE